MSRGSPVHPHLTQLQWRTRLQPPRAGELTLDAVANAVTRARKIQPQIPLQGQTVRPRVRVAAALLFERQGLPGGHPVGGQAQPIRRHTGLARVHRRGTRKLHLAQVRTGEEGPDLMLRPGLRPDGGPIRAGQPLHRAWVLLLQLDHPIAWADLKPKRPVRIQTGGQRTLNPQGQPAAEEDRTYPHLARPPGDIQLQPAGHPQGQVVVDSAIDRQTEPISILLLGCTCLIAEPETPAPIEPGLSHLDPVQHQGQEPGLGWHREPVRGPLPLEPPAEAVSTRRQLDRRNAPVKHRRDGLIPVAHIQGPGVPIPRERNPGFPVDLPDLGERPAACVQVQVELPGPGTEPSLTRWLRPALASSQTHRTGALVLRMKDPGDPRRQRIRDLRRRSDRQDCQ